VATEFPLEPGLGRAAAAHFVGIETMHRAVCQDPGSTGGRLVLFANTGRGEIFV
jgi:hypothetical protein